YSVFAGDELTATATSLPSPQGLPAGGVLRVLVDGEMAHEAALATTREDRTLRVTLPAAPGEYVVQAEVHAGGSLLARDAADVLVVERAAWDGGAVRAGDM